MMWRMSVSEYVAEEVRVIMARRQMTGVQVGDLTRRGQRWVSRRMRADVPITVDDLFVIAKALDVDPRVLLPRLDSNQEPAGYGTVVPLRRAGLAHAA